MASNKVEQEFSLSQVEREAEKIVEIETFLAVERALLRHVENLMLESPTPGLAGLGPVPVVAVLVVGVPDIAADDYFETANTDPQRNA